MRDAVVIVGGGLMGCGIAAKSALAGNQTIVVESNPDAVKTCPQKVIGFIDELEQSGLASCDQARRAKEKILCIQDLEESCKRAFFVIEAVPENLELKQKLFKQLDSWLPPEVPIASNTSGLRITDIAAETKHPERTATAHFWFPAHLVPLVEVVMSKDTSMETAQWIKDTLLTWGKAPVIVKQDLPGQLANRILQAVIREASSIVEMGLATPEDVDTAVKMGMGIRFPVWGPLEHVDAVGIDLCCGVQNTVLPSISAKTEASDGFKEMLAQGNLGHKTGKGFYDWSVKDMNALAKLRNDFIIHSLKMLQSYGRKEGETV